MSIVGILSLPVLMYERTNFEYGILKRKLQTCHTNYRNHGCNSQFKRSMSQISSIKLRRSNILYSWHKADMQNIELCSQKGQINHRNISLSTGILALHNFPRIIADIRHKPIINRLNCFQNITKLNWQKRRTSRMCPQVAIKYKAGSRDV